MNANASPHPNRRRPRNSCFSPGRRTPAGESGRLVTVVATEGTGRRRHPGSLPHSRAATARCCAAAHDADSIPPVGRLSRRAVGCGRIDEVPHRRAIITSFRVRRPGFGHAPTAMTVSSPGRWTPTSRRVEIGAMKWDTTVMAKSGSGPFATAPRHRRPRSPSERIHPRCHRPALPPERRSFK